MKKIISKLTAAVTLAAIALSPIQSGDTFTTEAIGTPEVYFTDFDSSVNGGDVIRGVDVSSIIAIENAGVDFFNDYGNKQDIFKTLSEKGVNYVRVRVWNKPYTTDGHSYGGGNNDVYTAAEIGKRAAQYGIKLLVDLQYSDFWADPGKQTVPKEWINYSHEQKKQAIYDYTKSALKIISEAGADIGMVQVGNETNCFFCGEKDMYKICDMFSSGCKAVREFDRDIMIALHFANPATGYFDWYAQVLNECRVDYDVFAASYYSYWHGTTQNLTSVLKAIADKYNKYVMVAETAYPYTNEDGDTFGNAVSASTSDVELRYDISVDGQAKCITDVFQAVANVGSKGIGAFYWEPAWLGKNNISWEEQSRLWNEYGSGWATYYAGEYDSSATETGGSAYDNQALFDFGGKPLDSLNVFSKIYPQKNTPTIENASIDDAVYRIKNAHSRLYLTVANGKGEAGANVIQYASDGYADYNSWTFVSDDNGYYYIRSETGGKEYYLDLDGGKADNKTNIGIYTDTQSDAQKFKLIENDDGTYYIVTKNTNNLKAVEIADGSDKNGGNAQQYEINGHSCQKWILEPVEEYYMLGDSDRDDSIDIFDLCVLRENIKNHKYDKSSDLNMDKNTDMSDYVMMMRFILGEGEFKAEKFGTPKNTIFPHI